MSETKNYTPTSHKIEWHLTYRCNLACVNCNRLSFLNTPHTPDLTIEDIKDFIRQANELNWKPDIIIIGGEPTISDIFHEACGMARNFVGRHGLVQVWSNASAPNSMEILQRAKNDFSISVPIETHKAKSQVLHIDDIFVSPADFGIKRDSCYAHCNTICGVSFDSGGYSPCAQGGSLDAILKLGIRTKRLADLFDNEWAAATTEKMCRNCGNAFSSVIDGEELKQWRKNVTGCKKKFGSYMSETWLNATGGLK